MSALFTTLLMEAGAGLVIATSLATYAQRRWATPRGEVAATQD
jgi:hypothetical protein